MLQLLRALTLISSSGVLDVPLDKRGADRISTMSSTGEVVCDSILQNKHKTKTYWEQMMALASAPSEPPKAQFLVGPLKAQRGDLLSVGVETADDNKHTSELSEQDFYDARSQISLNSPLGTVEHLDDSGPKIVETVAKKLIEVDNIKLVSTGDGSVIARDIRLQQEKEEALLRDREKALQKAVVVPQIVLVTQEAVVYDASIMSTTQMATPTPAETKIAMELREMREREEELRALRQSLTIGKEDEDPLVATVVTDDTFNSIPNTDEGNYSEYGSEEKELSLDGNNSRMMSPEVPNQVNFLHTRTQSMDSMSSGHSSGSGSGPHESAYHSSTNIRRRITVKPYEEPEEEEEVPTYMRGRANNIAEEPLINVVAIQLDKSDAARRNLKETPIEREIRLARERESELRREQRLPPFGSQTTLASSKQEVRRTHRDAITNDPRSVQHRLATNRIQQEINEATERENELRSAGTIQTTSEDTVDSKVTRFTDLAEFSIEEQDRKMQRAVSTSHIPSAPANSTPNHPAKPPSSLALNELNNRTTLNRSVSTNILSSPTLPSPTRRFGSSSGQKGIMERFLASRGKLTGVTTTFSASNSPSSSPRSPARPISPILRQDNAPMSLPTMMASTPKPVLDVTPIAERQVAIDGEEKEKERVTPLRKGYTSAEDKIQAELQEMRRREEELRLQRVRMFAQSQPNLLSIMDDDSDEADQPMSNDDFDSPMSIGSLRASLSNPNLLDSEETETSDKFQPSNKSARKRNALIAQWENRIQQFTVEH